MFSIFQSFYNKEKKIGASTCTFSSDNVGKNPFDTFQISCLSIVFFIKSAPNQNAMTEHRKRQLIEITHSFTSWLCSQQFWSDVLILCYIVTLFCSLVNFSTP